MQIGDKFNCYDDGKVRPSRHSVITIVDIIPRKKWTTEQKNLVCKTIIENEDLFSSKQTELIVGKYYNDKIYFLKTTYDEYFSTGWSGGLLDVDGTLTKNLIESLENNDFDYSDIEIQYIIKCLNNKETIELDNPTQNILDILKNVYR